MAETPELTGSPSSNYSSRLSNASDSSFTQPSLHADQNASWNEFERNRGELLDHGGIARNEVCVVNDHLWAVTPMCSPNSTAMSYDEVAEPTQVWDQDGCSPQFDPQDKQPRFTLDTFSATSSKGYHVGQRPVPDLGSRVSCGYNGCSKTFSKQCDLTRHENTIHSGTPIWHCGCCLNSGLTFDNTRKDNLKQHLQKSHGLEKYEQPQECFYCFSQSGMHYLFSSTACLRNHEMIHHLDPSGNLIPNDREALLGSQNEESSGICQAQHDCRPSSKPIQRTSNLPQKRRNCESDSCALTHPGIPESNLSAFPSSESQELPPLMSTEVRDSQLRQFWPQQPNQFGLSHVFPIFNHSNIVLPQKPGLAGFGAQFNPLAFPIGVSTNMTKALIPLLDNGSGGAPNSSNVPVASRLSFSSATAGTSIEVIYDFYPTYFMILCTELAAIEGSLDVEDFNKQYPQIPPITYSPTQRTLTLHGPELQVRSIYERFNDPGNVATVYALQKLQQLERYNIDEVLRKVSCSTEISTPKKDHEPNLGIFTLQAQHDAKIIAAWDRFVVPCLPEILLHTVGHEYSVCLVREGHSKANSWPCARIQTPRKPSLQNQDYVRKRILQQLTDYPGTPPSIRFVKGKTTDLVDGGHENGKDSRHAASTEDVEDDELFPHTCSYWPQPGMGASVGLFGDRKVSGTLGGYIMVDDKRYLLVSSHMIDEAEKHGFQGYGNRLRLTSPSLADVDEVNKFLKHSLLSSDAAIRSLLPAQGEYIRPSEVESLKQRLDLSKVKIEVAILLSLLSEVAKESEEYVIGTFTGQRVQKRRQYFGSPFTPGTILGDYNWIRMDWSIFETTNEHRIGENRQRYSQLSDSEDLDYSTRDDVGVGIKCQQACDLQSNTPLHYVGRKSGLRRGEINPSRIMISTRPGEQPTNEWFMVVNGPPLTLDELSGDSGAWVINDASLAAMAVLHGYADPNLLLVTPLKDIMRDIEDVTGATQVSFPPTPPAPHTPPPHTQLAINLTDVRDKTKPAKRYNIASLLNPKVVDMMLKRGTDHDVSIPEAKSKTSPPPSLDENSSSQSVEPELSTPIAELEQRFQLPSPVTQKIRLPPIRTLEESQALGRLQAIPSM